MAAFGRTYQDQTGDTGPSGYMLLRPEAVASQYQEISCRQGNPTVVRVLPALKDGQPLPYRYGPGPGEFTDWMVALETVTFGIEGTITFICQIPDDKDPTIVRPVREAVPPPWIFFRRIESMAKTDEYSRWRKWFDGARGRAAAIQRPQRCGYMHVIVVQHSGKDYHQTPLGKRVLLLRKTARESLEYLCNQEQPAWQGHPEASERFVMNNWLDPQQGRLLSFRLNPGGAAAAAPAGGPVDFSAGYAQQQRPGYQPAGGQQQQAEVARYQCTLGDVAPIQNPDVVCQWWRPWEQTLQLWPPDKQVELMARVFPPELLIAAFSDTHWLPDSIRHGRVVDVPSAFGAQPGGGYPTPGSQASAQPGVPPAATGPAPPPAAPLAPAGPAGLPLIPPAAPVAPAPPITSPTPLTMTTPSAPAPSSIPPAPAFAAPPAAPPPVSQPAYAPPLTAPAVPAAPPLPTPAAPAVAPPSVTFTTPSAPPAPPVAMGVPTTDGGAPPMNPPAAAPPAAGTVDAAAALDPNEAAARHQAHLQALEEARRRVGGVQPPPAGG